MDFRRVLMNNGPAANADTIVRDPHSTIGISYISLIGFDNSIKTMVKEFNRKNIFNIARAGNFQTAYKAYDVYKHKSQDSDYSHAILVRKDTVTLNSHGQEVFNGYVFVDMEESEPVSTSSVPEKLQERIFDKLYKSSPVPIVEEWMEYIVSALIDSRRLTELSVIKPPEKSFRAFRLNFRFDDLFNIVSTGLSNRIISINGATRTSEKMTEVSGLDSYLNNFSEILASRIQQSFQPKFIPGESKYSERLETFYDYAEYKGIRMYEAQKAVAQATSNNLDKSSTSLIIGEMGVGKTLLGISSIYTNAKKEATTNVVLCPPHLVEKWKKEIDKLMPLSTSYIVENFDHFLTLEKEMNNPRRRRHLFLIMSKETAKFGYEERPAVLWSESKRSFVCPECGKRLYREEYEGKGKNKTKVKKYLTEEEFSKKYAYNQECINEVSYWDKETLSYKVKVCGNKLWTPLIKEDDSDWLKLGKGMGWVCIKHIPKLFERYSSIQGMGKNEAKMVEALSDAISIMSEDKKPIRAPRKFPVASYIKKYYKGKIDYLIADELHLYKSGDSDQGQAFGDLVSAANKTIGLTGTLLNGYANGLFYILYRSYSHLMKKDGFDYSDEMEFTKQFGVIRKVTRFSASNDSLAGGSRLGSKEKTLPGVSPLVFTKFLLENAAFISLPDIGDGLPDYQEIPVPVDMDPELANAYSELEYQLRQVISTQGSGRGKILGSMLQSLSAYPEQPYEQPPVLDPETGSVILTPPELNKGTRNKERALLDLVRRKVEAGEKVLIYYHLTNRTDIGKKVPEMLEEAGFKTAVLSSSTVSSKDREVWIQKKLAEGIDVLLCNPTLVETGLDLLEFTTIVFYQMGYNLFTMRQASRRSWRLSQTRDIEVYFMYYSNTIQEQALSLMATKLQASQSIEGKFSEEGLHAMSNNEDLLTQIASSVAQGIKHSVDVQVFEKTAIKNNSAIIEEKAASKKERVTSVKSYSAFGNITQKKKKKKKTITKSQLLFAELASRQKHVANLY